MDISAIVTAPFARREPEDEWTAARDSGAIPESLYDLYRRANFLSFGTSPMFLSDPDNLLFSYFCLIVRSVMEALTDADEQLRLYSEAEGKQVDPANPEHRKSWTKESSRAADAKVRRSFRDLLIALQTSLDALSELVAILSPGKIVGLIVGRAQFGSIEAWLGKPNPPLPVVATPEEVYLAGLHAALAPIIFPPPPESGWLAFMRLLRNKSAHLGHPLFRKAVLRGHSGEPHVFIPRVWPFLWEKHMKPSGSGQPTESLTDLLTANLLHQDAISFAKGLRTKVLMVVDKALSQISPFYSTVEGFQPNATALVELQSQSKTSDFKEFLAPPI